MTNDSNDEKKEKETGLVYLLLKDESEGFAIVFIRFITGLIVTLLYLLLLVGISKFISEQLVFGANFVLSNFLALPFVSIFHTSYSRSVKHKIPYFHFFRKFAWQDNPLEMSWFFFFADLFIIWSICLLAWPMAYILFLARVTKWHKTKNLPEGEAKN